MRSSAALTSEASGTRRTAGVVVDLDDVHRIRKAVGGTVNDVLIAVVAGALRRWLDERGDGSEGVAPRALIPVSRRRPRTAHPQGNRLSGYLIDCPWTTRTRSGGCVRCARRWTATRTPGPTGAPARSPSSRIMCRPSATGSAGPWSARPPGSGSTSSSPASPCPASASGSAAARLAEIYPLAPLARGQSLAVAVSTYRGSVHYGLVADAEAVPDLDRFAQPVTEEVETLDHRLRAPDRRPGLETGPGAP